MKTPATPCKASDITWGPKGGQCMNCGGEGPKYNRRRVRFETDRRKR